MKIDRAYHVRNIANFSRGVRGLVWSPPRLDSQLIRTDASSTEKIGKQSAAILETIIIESQSKC